MSIAGSSSGDAWKMSPSTVGSEESAAGPVLRTQFQAWKYVRAPGTPSRFRSSGAGLLLVPAQGQPFALRVARAGQYQAINPRHW